ncbi:hypothetical protein FE394_08725 [Xenorhabdus sp. Reich]|uniref:Uncharacterized protein n=1 Tax=Xenorhabdus littoralis TaxID=2582835 RepID=A0ABU4SKV3_9GAMM|nr:hypothetical protein [Xenorhabdus sp. Reich]MDX7999284.1 hypothetical protein [Xenorhabdus sp. Reich]
MKYWLLFFIPHVVTEDVVFEELEDGYYPVCCVDDVQTGEYFPYVGTMRSIAFMNTGYAPRLIGELRKFAPQSK